MKQFQPDVYGYAPTNAPLIMVMGSNEPDIRKGLIVYAKHGGKLGLTHMDRLQKADCVPDLINALELALATLARVKPPQPYDSTQGTRDVIKDAIAKAKGTP